MVEKPNILFIVVDALRAENLSCYGYIKPTSPNIDELAKEGVLFENAYSCTNRTDPSFTSIFSGKYPVSHGIVHHGPDIKREEVQAFNKTRTKLLSEILNLMGYNTMAIDWLGRWHRKGYNYYSEPEEVTPSLRGKALKYITKLPYPIYSTIRKTWRLMGFYHPSHPGESYTNLAIKLLKKNQKKNFFLLIHYWDAHTPFQVPDYYTHKFYKRESDEKVKKMLKRIKDVEWREIVRRYHLMDIKYIDEILARYDGAINFVDHMVGQLINFIKDEGLYDKTLIILTGDHGDDFVRDGIYIDHSGLYEPVIHIPLILAGGGITRGKRINGFVQHVDIVPTILDMLGVDIKNTSDFDGNSMLPLIYGRGGKIHSAVYSMDATAKWRFAIRANNYKYIYSPSKEDSVTKYGIGIRDVIELYDLKRDPEETQNIIKEKPEVGKEMESQLLEWINKLEAKKERIMIKNKISRLRNLGKI